MVKKEISSVQNWKEAFWETALCSVNSSHRVTPFPSRSLSLSLFLWNLQSDILKQTSHYRFHKNNASKQTHEQIGVTLRNEFTDHKGVSQKASFFLELRLFLVSERHRVSSCRFCENTLSKLHNENNDVTLWAEFTHHKAVAQKASFFLELRLFVVSERHRVSDCRFCENTVSKLLNENNDVTLWAEFTHTKEVSEKASLQICLRFFHYSPWDSTISRVSLLRFHKISASKLLHERVV